jgi:hypothetical protein
VTNHADWVNASLLDDFRADGEEKWLERHAGDEGAILERSVNATDERRNGGFIRLVEARNGRSNADDNRGDELDKKTRELVASPLSRAVRARQDARVPKENRDQMARIEKAENTWTRSRGVAIPTKENIGRALQAVVQAQR